MSGPTGRAGDDATVGSADDATAPASVALLGLGAMGSRLGHRLLDAGHAMRAWNRTPVAASGTPAARLAERGATMAGSPADAADGADAVLVCVRDDEASARVWAAVEAVLGEDAVAVDLSTVTPDHVRRLAARLGARFLEAPMVGSRPQVEAGQLRLLVGGDAGTLDRAREILDALAGEVRHVGPVGHAAVAKLVVNGLLTAQLAAAGELLAATAAAGVDIAEVADVLTGLPVTSPALARGLGRALAGDTAPSFPLDLVAKDLGYLAGLPGGARPVLDGVGAVVAAAVAAGRDGADVVALAAPTSPHQAGSPVAGE